MFCWDGLKSRTVGLKNLYYFFLINATFSKELQKFTFPSTTCEFAGMFSLFLPVTSAFYLDGHRLSYLQRTLLGCFIADHLSVFHLGHLRSVKLSYFSNILITSSNLCSISLVLFSCYVLVFLYLISGSVIFLSLLTFILPSKLHVIFSASSLLFSIGPFFLWCFLIWLATFQVLRTYMWPAATVLASQF